ncbi:MAG: D-aminoacyl-tRNA deacylase [Candidatus Asgardarchaeia archaeon]
MSKKLKFVIVTSKKDKASMNMRERILENYGFTLSGSFDGNPSYSLGNVELITINGELIEADGLDREIHADYFIFASRHTSKSAYPSLLVHPTGNWCKEALYGGRGREISIAPAFLIRSLFMRIRELVEEESLTGYDVSLEATHHGPTSVEKPLVFVELGSDEENWRDADAAKILAMAIMEVIEEFIQGRVRQSEVAVGFGGPHYCPTFDRVMVSTDIALGHIIPKYAMRCVDEEIVRKAFERTYPPPKVALLDWKGLKKENRDFLIRLFEREGIRYERTKDII